MNQQQQDEAGQKLEIIYSKIAASNDGDGCIYFTDDELALIRWAFGLNQPEKKHG